MGKAPKSSGKVHKEKRKGEHIQKREVEKQLINKIVYGGLAFMGAVASVVLAYLLFAASPGITSLDPNNVDQLTKVFYGGEPWLVVCQQKGDLMKDVITKSLDALAEDDVQVGVVQCSAKLPSNKSISERFKLTKTKPVTAFLCANGVKPTQVPKEELKNTASLTKWVKSRAKLSIAKADRTSDLYSHCYRHKRCGIIVKNGELTSSEQKLVGRLAKQHRNVAFNVIDTKSRRFSLSKRLPDDTKDPLFLMVRKALTDEDKDTVAVKLHKGRFEIESLSSAVEGAVQESEDDGFKVLKKRPTVKSRGKHRNRSKPSTDQASKRNRKKKQQRKEFVNDKRNRDAQEDSSDTADSSSNTEGMVSDAERQRRKQLDEEMESMFQEADESDIDGEEEDEDNEDEYEEIIAEEDDM